MAGFAVGTVVAKNFLAFARVLARSFHEFHPDVPFFAVLADEVEGAFDPASEPFEIIPIDALGIPDLRRLCFQYRRLELSTATKPRVLSHLLDRGFTTAVFLDADILVRGRLDPLLEAAAAHAVALTPHLLDSLQGADAIARELNILQSGIFNGGCIGVSGVASGRRFLDWWQDRLRTHCRHDIPGGIHYDQRWLDLAPALFDDVCIVRDAGCNVAYWNLPERNAGSSCRFFHFSGFEPERPEVVTRYSRRLAMQALAPEASALFEQYVRLLEGEGNRTIANSPYAFGQFDNGVAIPDLARRIYLDLDETVRAALGDPFQAQGPHSYFRWLNEEANREGASGHGVTRLWEAVYKNRPDLQLAFPDVFGSDRRAFQDWIVGRGLRELNVAEAFVP